MERIDIHITETIERVQILVTEVIQRVQITVSEGVEFKRVTGSAADNQSLVAYVAARIALIGPSDVGADPAGSAAAAQAAAEAHADTVAAAAQAAAEAHADAVAAAAQAAAILAAGGYTDAQITALSNAINILLAAKRPTIRRVTTIASSATPAINCDTHDQYNMTALAANAVFGVPAGTPNDGQQIMYRTRDNGTSRTLGYNAIFKDSTAMPFKTNTTVGKVLYQGYTYRAVSGTWDLTAQHEVNA